jgi:hypothetical protein
VTPTICDAPSVFESQLDFLGACSEARDWARGKTRTEAWLACERGDWMMWYLYRTDQDHDLLRLIVRRCVLNGIAGMVPMNVFAQDGANEAVKLMDGPARFFSAAMTWVTRVCWVQAEAEATDADDSGLYSVRRASMLKFFADIIRTYYPEVP